MTVNWLEKHNDKQKRTLHVELESQLQEENEIIFHSRNYDKCSSKGQRICMIDRLFCFFFIVSCI